MRLVSLKMTCSACPSQWEGKTEDGQFLYARYRWGQLSWCVAGTIDDAIDGYNPNDQTFGNTRMVTVRDSLDGVMDTEEMLRLTGMEY